MKNVEFIACLINFDVQYALEYIDKLSLNEARELIDNILIINLKASEYATDVKELCKINDNLIMFLDKLEEKYEHLKQIELMKGAF